MTDLSTHMEHGQANLLADLGQMPAQDVTQKGRRLGFGFWLAIAFMVVIVLVAILAPWLPLKDPEKSYIDRRRTSALLPVVAVLVRHATSCRATCSAAPSGAPASRSPSGSAPIAFGMLVGGSCGMIAGYFRGRFDRDHLVRVRGPALVPGAGARDPDHLAARPQPVHDLVHHRLPRDRAGRAWSRRATTISVQPTASSWSRPDRSGARHRRIIVRELLPNVVIPMGALALLGMAVAIVAEGASGVPRSLGREGLTWGKLIQFGAGRTRCSRTHLDRVRTDPRAVPHRRRRSTSPATGCAATSTSRRPHCDAVRRFGRFGRVNEHLGVSEPTPASRCSSVDDLKTHFRTDRGLVRAVDGVTFSLERGKALGIVGESGSGKTVLQPIDHGSAARRRAVASRVGQVRRPGDRSGSTDKQMRHLWGARDVDGLPEPDDLAQPADEDRQADHRAAQDPPRHGPRRRPRDRRRSCCSDVRIPEAERRLDQYPHELSGGMRQRVMIAIALACGPTLLFADEPTTALDVTVQAQILDLIGEQRRDRNMSVILVTHDLGVVAGHTDEIAVMYGGQLVEKAPTKALFANMKMPYTEVADAQHPQARRPQPHAADRRSPAARRTSCNPPTGLPLRATLRLRPRQVPRRGAAARRRPSDPTTSTPAGTRSARPSSRNATPRPRQRGASPSAAGQRS